MDNPLVSIIIPSYNRAHLISYAIESVISQTYVNWELIICDDRSEDNTLEILEKFIARDSRVSYYVRPEDSCKGANTCRNIGFEKAKGSFVKWLDSDDILLPECLEKQVEVHSNESNSAVVFCDTGFFEQDGMSQKFIDKKWCPFLKTENITKDLITGKLRWAIMSGLWRKTQINKNPFREELMNSQEWLFHIEFSLKNLHFSILDKVLVAVGIHKGSMSDVNNKKGKYYFNASKARYFAFQLIKKYKPEHRFKLKWILLKRFTWYHVFVLYKGSVGLFFKLFQYYPKMLLNLF
jgi:glycosyltransferase involved in cell wall biosynthesis